jgi:hypothetical protein
MHACLSLQFYHHITVQLMVDQKKSLCSQCSLLFTSIIYFLFMSFTMRKAGRFILLNTVFSIWDTLKKIRRSSFSFSSCTRSAPALAYNIRNTNNNSSFVIFISVLLRAEMFSRTMLQGRICD